VRRAAPLFEVTGTAMARLATFPTGGADATRVDLEPDRPGYADRLRGYLDGLFADPAFREAVEVSSASLAAAVERLESGRPVELARLERTAFAATRYRLRMSSRPTPFGLLAGVAAVGFGDDGDAVVRIGAAHEKFAQVDAGWLSSLVADWLRRPEVRRALRVTANELCTVRGDRLVLTYPRGRERDGAGQAAREVSVRHTAAVRAALAAAGRPVGYPALAATLAEEFPAVDPARIEALLGDLVEKEFLLTDLPPDPSRPDPLGHLRARLPDPADRALVERAGAVVTAYARTPLGAGRERWHAAVDTLRDLHATDKPVVQVDLRFDADLRLPRIVAEETLRAATALCRMSRDNPYEGHLEEYHRAFVERYGAGQLVPLPDLLDPHTGLDAPASYLVPRSSRADPRRGYPDEPDAERAELVAELAWSAAAAGAGSSAGAAEVVLTEDVIDRLGRPSELPPPAAVEMCVQVLAGSLDAVRRGDFRLALTPVGGSTRIGALAGRFAEMIGLTAPLAELYRDATAPDGPRWAQLLWQSASARPANVMRVPRLVPDVVSVGMFADPSDLGLGDLAVGATTERMYVVSTRDGRQIEPTVPHALNPKLEGPNAIRLLIDIAQLGTRSIHWWNWGRLESLPSLPRVRYGRTIVAPARWRPDGELGRSAEPWPRWCDRLAAWRDTWGVPDRVETTIADHRVELDLGVGLHRQLLRQELRRGRNVVLMESLVGEHGGRDWLDGHAAEFVVQLTRARSQPPPAPPPAAVLPVRPRTRHVPGGEWLFAKLYAIEEAHAGLLAAELPALVRDLPPSVDRWFFIRYRDPDPHLRLRFHGDPARLAAEVLPRLHRWATAACERRTARHLVLDTYEPETARYGGPELIDAAEQLFCADSESVIRQLQLRLRDIPPEIAVAANYVDLLRSLGDWDWEPWVLRRFGRAPVRGLDRDRLALVDPAGGWSALRAVPGGADLVDSWAERSVAAAKFGSLLLAGGRTLDAAGDEVVDSLLHMHANRLAGIDRAVEDLARAVVRERVHAARARGAR
jgi:thiopeptide-type bacteriocin biosynthesis protein